jgi:hypothetical protein
MDWSLPLLVGLDETDHDTRFEAKFAVKLGLGIQHSADGT